MKYPEYINVKTEWFGDRKERMVSMTKVIRTDGSVYWAVGTEKTNKTYRTEGEALAAYDHAKAQRNPIREVVTVSKNPLAESFATPWLWGAVAVGTVVGIGYAIYTSRQKTATPPATNKNTFPAVPPMHFGDRPIVNPNEGFLVLGDGYAMSVTAALGNDPTLQNGSILPWGAPLALSLAAAKTSIASLPSSLAPMHVVLLAFSQGATNASSSGDVDSLDSALVAAGKRPIWILAPGDEISAFGSYVASVPSFEYYAMGEGSIAGLVHEMVLPPIPGM